MNDAQYPFELEAVIFDLDGVVTRTASVHAAAWKETFDELLERRGVADPFHPVGDYLKYVDGKPRPEGVRSFLASRGIVLPDGTPDDVADSDTVHGVGRRKNELFNERLRRDGVDLYASSIEFIRALRAAGVRTGVVTSSRNGRAILDTTGTAGLFDQRIDGQDLEEMGLRGKPFPDTFARCADLLDVTPSHAVVVEDAVSGVDAARRGGFGLVVGVDRGANADALIGGGADLVVTDLDELDPRSLDAQFRARREEAAWHLEQEGFDPAAEHSMESLYTVGNGSLGVRGAPDTPLPGSQGDLFVAGIYDRKADQRPYSELEFMNVGGGDRLHAELVSAPFPFRTRITIDGLALDPSRDRTREYRRELDLKRAIVHTLGRFEVDRDRYAIVETSRCASAADRHLLLQEISVTLENHSGTIEFDASLEESDLSAAHPHLVPLPVPSTPPGVELLRFATQASGFEICIASRVMRVGGGTDAVASRVDAVIGETVTFRRYAVVYNSRDTDDPCAAALADITTRAWRRFDAAVAEHVVSWERTWEHADVVIEGSYATEQALRFNAYHLHSAGTREPHVSVPARALTGRAYEGHIFWDVEIFMLPFYIHTAPEIARNALLYRHHTLDGARKRAQEGGYRGASFAWESTVTGEDVTPRKIKLKTTGREIPIYTGTQQIHVTADVAYGVWRYWDGTGDRAFLRDTGAEILAETARFWTSRCERGAHHFHIRGVVGPDEYHHSVDDNAFTNWMARFNLERAAWTAGWMQREYPSEWAALCERLDLAADEVAEWAAVAEQLYFPEPDRHGVIEQFAGFFDLDDYPLPAAERLQAPINRLFDWEKINRLKLIKQADLLMLPFLFPDRFSHEELVANYHYYEPLTDHGSSLSPSVHAALAARLGLHEAARRYWRQGLWLDLSNVMTNSALGVHPACMGATWQALVFGLLGVRFTDDGPTCAPDAFERLPETWRSVALKLLWRGRSHPVEVRR